MIYKIIVDKQSRGNPSNEKREYSMDIEELRVKGDVYDSLIITAEEDYVMRRLALSELQVLTILDEPKKEVLEEINIELFEGDNYVYLADESGNKFYAEYLIKNDFNDIYVTRNEMNSAINQTAGQIELSVNQKLTSYATNNDIDTAVTELNSKITQTVSEITSTVSKTYSTKIDTENAISTAKTEIKQTTDAITQTVSKKVGNDEVISKINQSAEEVGINANKIELSANDVLNLLAGNTINLSSKNISISSSHFIVDKNGNVKIKDDTGTAGSLHISADGTSYETDIRSFGAQFIGNNGYIGIDADFAFGGGYLQVSSSQDDFNNCTTIQNGSVSALTVNQRSKESIKKNIQKYEDNALEIIKNSEIYEYNFKSEKDEDKKHIGFVIPDLGGEYKTPNKVISANNEGIDTYSMISILWKAVQELSQKVQELERGQANEEN